MIAMTAKDKVIAKYSVLVSCSVNSLKKSVAIDLMHRYKSSPWPRHVCDQRR